jgi:hypothetical protein
MDSVSTIILGIKVMLKVTISGHLMGMVPSAVTRIIRGSKGTIFVPQNPRQKKITKKLDF